MMRLVVIALLLSLGVPAANAVPAAPIVRSVQQPDGTTIRIRTIGDEWNNWTVTETGYPVIRAESSGWWYFADTDFFGDLEATACRAGVDDPADCCVAPNTRPRITPPPVR